MNLKVKIFEFKGGAEAAAETKINEWLEPLKHIEVLEMTQSTTDYYSDGSMRSTVVTILYKENFQQ